MTAFGDALLQLLQERHMSQNELGRRLGLSGAAVNLWVKGRSTPTRESVELVEDELAIEPRGSLLTAAGYSTNATDQPTVESLIRADPGLDGEDKRVILRILRLARERHAETQQGLIESE